MDSCAICLNPVRKTRNTSELKCGHIFHVGCLGDWENKGGETCPLCRKQLSGAEFRVTLTIENLNKSTSNAVELPMESIRSMVEQLHLDDSDLTNFSTEIHFDVDNLEELREVLGELGLPDINTLVFDTER
jgi:hypothetical protein